VWNFWRLLVASAITRIEAVVKQTLFDFNEKEMIVLDLWCPQITKRPEAVREQAVGLARSSRGLLQVNVMHATTQQSTPTEGCISTAESSGRGEQQHHQRQACLCLCDESGWQS
jgi:hypothetical protein